MGGHTNLGTLTQRPTQKDAQFTQWLMQMRENRSTTDLLDRIEAVMLISRTFIPTDRDWIRLIYHETD